MAKKQSHTCDSSGMSAADIVDTAKARIIYQVWMCSICGVETRRTLVGTQMNGQDAEMSALLEELE